MPRGSQCEPTRLSKRKGTRTLPENRDPGSGSATKVPAVVPARLRPGPPTHDRDDGTRPRERGRPARNGPQAHSCPGSAGVPPAVGRRPMVVLGARASRPRTEPFSTVATDGYASTRPVRPGPADRRSGARSRRWIARGNSARARPRPPPPAGCGGGAWARCAGSSASVRGRGEGGTVRRSRS